MADLELGLDLLEQATDLADNLADRAKVLGNRATALQQFAARTKSRSARDQSIMLYREAIDSGFLASVDAIRWTWDVTRALRARYADEGSLTDVDTAIAYVAAALRARDGRPEPNVWAEWLSNWADIVQTRVMSLRAERNPDVATLLVHLDLEVTMRQMSTRAARDDYPDHSGLWSNLGDALASRAATFVQAERYDEALTDARNAVDAQQYAVSIMPPFHPFESRIIANLSRARTTWERLEYVLGQGAERDLIDVTDTAMTESLESAITLAEAYLQHDHLASLDSAIALCGEVVERTAEAPASYVRELALRYKALYLRFRFERFNDFAYLNEAISIGRALIGLASNRSRGEDVQNLAVCLMLGSSAPEVQAEAITLLRTAIEEAKERGDEARRISASHDLSVALRQRFERMRELADIREAVTLSREVAASPQRRADEEQHGEDLCSLGIVLQISFRFSTHNPSELDEAIECLRAGVGMISRDHARSGYLSSLALAYQLRYSKNGAASDIDLAIKTGRSSLDATPRTDQRRARCASNLGLAYRLRFEKSHDVSDGLAAIELGREAVSGVAIDAAEFAANTFNLAKALAEYGSLQQDQAALEEGLALAMKVAELPIAAPSQRLASAVYCALHAARLSRWPLAASAFEISIDLLERVVWQGLSRAAREALLNDYGKLASSAAAAALNAGDASLALSLLERGRSVLWRQQLRLRDGFEDVIKAAPEEHRRLVAVAKELEQYDAPAAPLAGRPRPRQALAAEWDQLVETIRKRPGCEEFLHPVSTRELLSCGSEGPVIVLNVTDYRSDAFLIVDGSLHTLALPELSLERVTNVALAHVEGLQLFAAAKTSDDVTAQEEKLLQRIDWLTTYLVRPVLAKLRSLGALPGAEQAERTRLWWCPTGLLTVLPIHAAAQPHITSSYASSIGALLRARKRSAPSQLYEDRLLVVAVPEYKDPKLAPLKGALVEAEVISRRFGMGCTVRSGLSATREQVLKDLFAYKNVHFACHGDRDADDPANSALFVFDGSLTVSDIAQASVEGEFAFLSACSTAAGALQLPDEAVHPAAAMQAAGYRHVAATFWPIADELAPWLADKIYEQIHQLGRIRADHIAHALHDAIETIRMEYATQPSLWASYAHFGP